MKRILITGGSHGIGKALVCRFLQDEGVHVTHLSRTPGDLPPSDRVTFLPVDLADARQLAQAGEHLATAPAFDVVINNAGVFVPSAFPGPAAVDAFEHMMRLNVAAPYAVLNSVVPAMQARGSGSIVNVCSTASVKAFPHCMEYVASKHALLGLNNALRTVLAPFGIRVIAVLPGPVRTRSWNGIDLPAERFLDPDDVAELVFRMDALPPQMVVEQVLLRPLSGDIE